MSAMPTAIATQATTSGTQAAADPSCLLEFRNIRIVYDNAIEAIRDVIAFPKTQRGQDLLMDAPSAVEPGQLDELRLRIAPAPGPAGRAQ